MLVKFDHLTYAANRKSVADIINTFTKAGYTLTLQEEQAKNMPTKMAYMKNQDATHGLHFMAPPAEGGIPVEIVSYENTTTGTSCIEYAPRALSFAIKTSDSDSCKELLLALGCDDKGEDNVGFQGALDEFPIDIKIEKRQGINVNLDNEGICCPTIFVRPLNKSKKKLEEAGFKCSEVETFDVQDTHLYVFFVEGNGGEIFEITSNKL
jgi:hypothetical protein